jgi:hypothetical protein
MGMNLFAATLGHPVGDMGHIAASASIVRTLSAPTKSVVRTPNITGHFCGAAARIRCPLRHWFAGTPRSRSAGPPHSPSPRCWHWAPHCWRGTVFFSDIEGFSQIAERISPEASITLTNEYLSAMTNVIESHGGYVDKNIGDSAVALFGGTGRRPAPRATARQNLPAPIGIRVRTLQEK